MFNIISDTHSKFQEVQSLLSDITSMDTAYFTKLSDVTQVAYISMNEGMCVNTTVCHQCAEHRDFLQNIISILEELANGEPLTSEYRNTLTSYAIMVNETLKKISEALISLKRS
jgi:NADH:ubiquinone oxidoreductase subunit F (NADH-binding)